MVETARGIAINFHVRQLILAGLALSGSAGCRSIPFQEIEYVPVDSIPSSAAREQFARALPSEFQRVDTMVFQYKGSSIAAIGYTAVDTRRNVFTVVGISPVGIKLFELSGDRKEVECSFALEEFMQRGDFARAVADDIRRIYFDRIPPPGAEADKEKYRIIFRDQFADPAARAPSSPGYARDRLAGGASFRVSPAGRRGGGPGTMEYVFAGADPVLIRKRYYREKRNIWDVFYYEYRRENGKLHPGGIVFRHYQYRYQLVMRLKEIRE